jgi:ferrous-iron efflux pump FieF
METKENQGDLYDPKSLRLKKIASFFSVSVAITLAVSKVIVAFMTGSLAVLSSMIDSLADIGASGITFVSVKFSTSPPTKKHRFGLGKAEALSALAQSAFIGGSGCFILYDIVYKLIYPEPVVSTKLGLIVMFFSFCLTLSLVLFQAYVIKKTGSRAIAADSANYKGDLVTVFSIIIALLCVEYLDAYWADPLVAGFVACYLLYNSYKVGKDAINVLMDKELSDKTRQKITNLALENEFVKNIHDLRTRDAGVEIFVEFHLELDGKLSLEEAHSYAHIVENKIKKELKDAQITIHQEPAGLKDSRLDNIIKK